jgi:hypothetical protein
VYTTVRAQMLYRVYGFMNIYKHNAKLFLWSVDNFTEAQVINWEENDEKYRLRHVLAIRPVN